MKLWDSVWRTTPFYGTSADWRVVLPSDEAEVLARSTGDVTITNSGGLQALDPLGTAIMLALFTDARLPDYMIGRFGFTRADQHEWHGNTFGIDGNHNEEPLGSLLWTLRRAPLNAYTARMAEHFCALALQPLVRQKLITSYTIAAAVRKPEGRIDIFIRTYAPTQREFFAELHATQ